MGDIFKGKGGVRVDNKILGGEKVRLVWDWTGSVVGGGGLVVVGVDTVGGGGGLVVVDVDIVVGGGGLVVVGVDVGVDIVVVVGGGGLVVVGESV